MFTTQTKNKNKSKSNNPSPFQKKNGENAFFQPKLKVGKPGDKYEVEADKFAERVVETTQNQGVFLNTPSASPFFPSTQTSAIQNSRMEEFSEQEEISEKPLEELVSPVFQSGAGDESGGELLQEKCKDCEEELVQTKPEGKQGVSPSVENAMIRGNTSGNRINPKTRVEMERGFGADFTKVKIHTDSQSVQMNQELGAQAFTYGNDIYFDQGKYNPAGKEGKKLLAHELTHVIQQGHAKRLIQRFTTCETETECPRRERGEVSRSRSTPHRVEIYDPTTFGILISNFAVGEHQTKSDLVTNPVWTFFAVTFSTLTNDEWEVRGYTDCQGGELRNRALRTDRAGEVATLLPSPASSGRIGMIRQAPLSECIADNSTAQGRRKNRSVLIRRMGGSTGPTPPTGAVPIGPVRPPGTPASYCDPYTGLTGPAEAAAARLFLNNVWLPYANTVFGPEVHRLWNDYLTRPKGASLAPRVFRAPTNPIVNAFRIDPETVAHKSALYSSIVAAVQRTPEANIPLSGTNYLSPPIPLGTILPDTDLNRNIVYTNGHIRIPGNIAGGASPTGAPSSDAGPDLRLFTGTVQIARRRRPGGGETKRAIIDLNLQVIDTIDFCPGNPGGAMARNITIPMSRLEATPTETTYDLPFHVFVSWSETINIP